MKTCTICNIEKSLDRFSKKGLRKDGSQKYNSHCKDCHREIAKERYHASNGGYKAKALASRRIRTKKYRLEFIDYLRGKYCVDCGNNDIRVLEFDHLRDKVYHISEASRRKKLENLMDEIEKCEIVCCNCHRIRTLTRINSIRN